MRVLISDCANFDGLLPIAEEFGVGIEIQEFTSPEFLDNKQYRAKEIGAKIRNISLRGFHGPFSEMVPATRDQKIKDVMLERFETAYRLAQTVGANHFGLHTGFIPKTYPHDIWIKNSLEFWTSFLAGKNDSISIHMENVYEDDPSIMIELLDKINKAMQREAVSACLDVGHVNANSSRLHKEWITSLGARIKYVHVHNNGGVLDDHWGLWKGTINIPGVLDLLLKHSPDSYWMIEAVQPDIYKSVLWLKERGYLDK